MEQPIYKNKEFLYEEIIVKNKSCHKVAEELKVQRDTIAHWAKKFGINFSKRAPNKSSLRDVVIKETNIKGILEVLEEGKKEPQLSTQTIKNIFTPNLQPIEATVLGKKVSYKTEYDPTILVAVPRIENRVQYNIDENNLPFKGFDVWNCYEISSLTNKGRPVSLVGKIIYPCNSKYLIESKSLKLYLNSFNMTKTGNNVQEVINNITQTIKKDLSNKLQTTVGVKLFTEDEYEKNQYVLFKDYINIENIVNLSNIEFINYKESPELLKIVDSKYKKNIIKISSNMLRSLCKITNQPDWGNVYIYIILNNNKTIDLKSLVEYIISFRNENHFHEEVTEMIYKRLYDKFQSFIETLLVGTIYVRRGGIDICPIRSLKEEDIDKNFIKEDVILRKKYRQ